MKMKILFLFAGMLSISLLVTSNTMAQQLTYSRPHNVVSTQQAASSRNKNDYSFRLFSAPNNTYGYDVLKNRKPVFHQFVLTCMTTDGKRFFATKEQAEKAAASSIEKMNKGMRPFLTEPEIKKILLQ
jgi:hypothetical protein